MVGEGLSYYNNAIPAASAAADILPKCRESETLEIYRCENKKGLSIFKNSSYILRWNHILHTWKREFTAISTLQFVYAGLTLGKDDFHNYGHLSAGYVLVEHMANHCLYKTPSLECIIGQLNAADIPVSFTNHFYALFPYSTVFPVASFFDVLQVLILILITKMLQEFIFYGKRYKCTYHLVDHIMI